MSDPISAQFENVTQLMESLMQLARPLNKGELCQYLKIKKSTLEYYNGHGLPRFKVGNEVRYQLLDVVNFFRKRNITPSKERFAYADEIEIK